MKHVDLFNEFLRDVVNLNQTRVTDLETSIEAIKSAIRAADWKPHINGWMAHGSWAHKTIIRPVDKGEFDADLIVFVEYVSTWSAATYIDELYKALRANATYKDKISRSSHCITISYANDKKIDVAPCLTNRTAQKQLEVCNRTNDAFERTEPKQYTSWLIEKNGHSGNNSFRKVTRLAKYLRDIKTSFTCSSVLLTTILGNQVKASDNFADTPTALRTIFQRMDDWLQKNTTKPVVSNPFLKTEDFARSWTDDHYANFRDKIHVYRDWIDDAFSEENRSESISKWRRAFGDDFAKKTASDEARSVSKSIAENIKGNILQASPFEGDLVDAILRRGAHILPSSFDKQPHMEAPKWKYADQRMTVRVRADLHKNRSDGRPIKSVQSLEPLSRGSLHFTALSSAGGRPCIA